MRAHQASSTCFFLIVQYGLPAPLRSSTFRQAGAPLWEPPAVSRAHSTNPSDSSKGTTPSSRPCALSFKSMAAQSFVDYLRSKFTLLEVIVPTFAMSAGTMISLAADVVVMGNQRQLGPIDPLLQYAQDQLDFSERMVAAWLTSFMKAKSPDPDAEGKRITSNFNDASNHKSHRKRIGIDEAGDQGVIVEKLEDAPALQGAVLTPYHVLTIVIEQTPVAKIITSGSGQNWDNQWVGATA